MLRGISWGDVIIQILPENKPRADAEMTDLMHNKYVIYVFIVQLWRRRSAMYNH